MIGTDRDLAMVIVFACNLKAIQALHSTSVISRMSVILNTYRT
jgi:hypothetical protein